MDEITLTPNYAQWKQDFRQEAKALRKTLGKSLLTIQHIGSTAVPGIPARDEIDILLVAKDDADLTSLDYQRDADGHYRKPGFCLWILNKADASQAAAFYALRDFLLADAQAAKTYGDLKTYLASAYDAQGYQEEKAQHLRSLQEQADAAQRKKNSMASGMSLGMCIGMGVGLALGSATGQQGPYMAMGMCVGMCLGMVLGQNQAK